MMMMTHNNTAQPFRWSTTQQTTPSIFRPTPIHYLIVPANKICI